MVISFILVLLIALSGLAVTYLFAEDESFLWRISAGNIVGSALFGTFGLLITNLAGLSLMTASIVVLLTLLPLFLLRKKDVKHRFLLDWRAAKSRTQGIGFKKFLRVGYYLGFFLLFVFFFDRAIFETSEGIFTGGSQNLGDLPFHLGAIYSFTDGNNFPPMNPSFFGAKFSYPFVSDLLTAFLMKFGASIESAFLIQNVSWAFSLLVVLEKFVYKITDNKLAGKIAPILLLFSGGLGFYHFFQDFSLHNKGFFDFIWNLKNDYTIRSEGLRWGNSLNVLFITQRSLLLGMPLTIIVLNYLWRVFSTNDTPVYNDKKELTNEKLNPQSNNKDWDSPWQIFTSAPFIAGLIAGTLPLIHLHSLVVLFVVTGFLFFLKLEKWREWIVFGVGVAIIAVPELVWSISGSATRTSEFFGWRFGWHKGENESFIWFWIKNTGILIPLLAAGIYLLQINKEPKKEEKELKRIREQEQQVADEKAQIVKRTARILFYLPFIFLFIVSNTAKLAPWEWDNIKVLIYWFIGSLPFVSFALAWAYNRNAIFKVAVFGCLFLLTFAGALDVWRISTDQVKIQVFDADSVKIAQDIKLRTFPNALFLNAPTYNSPVVLSGRFSLMRYLGHLSSHGIDYGERFEDIKKIYAGDASADILLRKYNIEYVMISPAERNDLSVNESYFERFPVIAESGQYKVYKVKKEQ